MSIGENLKKRRQQLGLTLEELAKRVKTSRQTLSRYETGIIANIPSDKIEQLATALNTTPAYLMGWEEKPKLHKKGIKIPVLGEVPAGVPIEAIEEILDYEEITEEMALQGEHFALQIKGDSMEPKFSAGDIVIVRKQPCIESGQIAIVFINGEDATCKRVVKHDTGLSLVSLNPSYPPMFFTNKEVLELPISVLGRVVELRAKF